MKIQSAAIPLQMVNDTTTEKQGVRLFVLRLDLNHPDISGNKLYKLKYNLQEAEKLGKDTVLTFGGAFSNHIAATAAAGKEYGFKTIGIIRGEEYSELNPTLKFAKECGMELIYVSRKDYKNKNIPAFSNFQIDKFSNYYLVPEGGANELGIKGCTEITKSILVDFDYVCCSCGTGATLTGIILSLKENQKAIGFQILKGENYIKQEVEGWLRKFNHPIKDNYSIEESYHLGGYAKVNPELFSFVERFNKENEIPLDYVYEGKMMFGIYDMIEKGYFEKGKTIVAVHGGGLQGNKGFDKVRTGK